MCSFWLSTKTKVMRESPYRQLPYRQIYPILHSYPSGRVALSAELSNRRSYPTVRVLIIILFVSLGRESEVVGCPRLQVLRAIYPSLSRPPTRSSTSTLSDHVRYFRSCHADAWSDDHAILILSLHMAPFYIFYYVKLPQFLFFFQAKNLHWWRKRLFYLPSSIISPCTQFKQLKTSKKVENWF